MTAARRVLPRDPPGAHPHLGSAAVVVAAGLIVWVLWRLTEVPHVSIVFLCAVFVSAVRWGRGPGLFAAGLSIAAACFFFYPPIYSFGVDSRRAFSMLRPYRRQMFAASSKGRARSSGV